MSSICRTTVRFDLRKPEQQHAVEIIKKLRDERGMSLAEIIAPAVADYYDNADHMNEVRRQIREIVREEIAAVPIGSLLHTPLASAHQEEENNEPDSDELAEAYETFGS